MESINFPAAHWPSTVQLTNGGIAPQFTSRNKARFLCVQSQHGRLPYADPLSDAARAASSLRNSSLTPKNHADPKYTAAIPTLSRGSRAAHTRTAGRAGRPGSTRRPVHGRRPARLAPARRHPAQARLRHLLPLHRRPHRSRGHHPGRLPQGLTATWPRSTRKKVASTPGSPPSPATSSSTTTAAPASTAPPTRSTSPSPATTTAPPSPSASPTPVPAQEQHYAGLELRATIQQALQKLSPDLREAVILRDLEDMDYKEIAVVLKIPEGTVKSRISRGRAELARLLQRIEGQVM